MLDILLILALINGVFAIPLILLWRRDFRRLGHVSQLGAAWSGVTMHGHAILTFVISWIDRGSLGATSFGATIAGWALIAGGAGVIAAGRYAYGDVARVYGLKEDLLIEQGIYRWTRNPQYFGYWLMFMGAGLAAMSVWGFVLALAFAPAIHLHITLVEEPHLRRAFGEAYDAYCARVARYLGGPAKGRLTS